MNSTNLKSPVPAALEELKAGQHLMMTIAAQHLIEKFDALITLPKGEESFFADQLCAHFGDDIKKLRGCIANSNKLAAHVADMAKEAV